MKKEYYVYILRSKSGTLYIGVTSDMSRRMAEHKQGIASEFTKKYNVNILIHCESYSNPKEAIAREKQLKKWSRKKKIDLVTKSNPMFKELSV